MTTHYVEKILQDGEQIRHKARLHWIVYAPGLSVWVLAAAIWIAAQSLSILHWLVMIAVWLILAVGLVLITRAWFEQWTTEIAITNRRVVLKRGFIRRNTTEIHMDKVASVDVDQSILGRIFDYGDVLVHSTGTELEPLRTVAAPLELRNHITAV